MSSIRYRPTQAHDARPAGPPGAGVDLPISRLGPVGRLGRYTATHFRVVLIAWGLVAVALGLVAPRVETALSGAGWETTGSQSVQARALIERNFQGLSSYSLTTVISSPTKTLNDPPFRAAIAEVERTLRADRAVRTVLAPTPGVSYSRDGHTAIVQAGAARDSNAMVQAADRLKGKLTRLTSASVRVSLTGAPAMWSDFNAATRSAMLKSEVISWPLTVLILLVAFGSLVAAGLPLMLTMVGLIAAAGSLYLSTKLMPVSIWATKLRADVRARARGRLRAVHRAPLPGRVLRLTAVGCGRRRGDDGHRRKAVLLSGATVLISLSAVLLVPSPAFRSTSLGIMLAVIFVLAATLTLLPAVLAKLGPNWTTWRSRGRIRRASLRQVRRVAERLWKRPVAYGALRARCARRARDPRDPAEDRDAVDQGRPDR